MTNLVDESPELTARLALRLGSCELRSPLNSNRQNMVIECHSLGRGRLRLEVLPGFLKCERKKGSTRHSFEVPLTEVSPTIERWEGTAAFSYVAAAVCALLPFVAYWIDPSLSFSDLVWHVVAFAAGLYFFLRARARSGSYYILRNTKEASRDVWMLRSGREAEVDHFIAYLREQVIGARKEPSK